MSPESAAIADMPPQEFIEWAFRTILRRVCSPDDCEYWVAQLDNTAESRLALLHGFLVCEEYANLFLPDVIFPAGHFYSPVPSQDDVSAGIQRTPPDLEASGVNLHLPEQRRLLEEFAKIYPTIPFHEQGTPGFRYRYENENYVHGDAIMLHLMIRWLKPRRIIEVGSGNSSCVTLDTNEHFFDNQIRCTFIEPFPDFLQSLLKPTDKIDLIPVRLQEVDLSIFDTLAPRDVLFIDSTHVSKLNSDVNRLFFEILPRLNPGVFIHIHDVFPAFEYPEQWLREGRAWNEQYLLRAFLQCNDHFRIRLFPGLLAHRDPAWFEKHMPLVLVNSGGALWIEKLNNCKS